MCIYIETGTTNKFIYFIVTSLLLNIIIQIMQNQKWRNPKYI